MKLSVSERLTLLGLLPEESSYAGVREINRLMLQLGLNDEESKQIEVKRIEGNRIGWNQEKALGLIVDIPMGEWITEVVRMQLRDLDKNQQLRPEHMSLFEKFIFDYE
jgi:hypothetical protein